MLLCLIALGISAPGVQAQNVTAQWRANESWWVPGCTSLRIVAGNKHSIQIGLKLTQPYTAASGTTSISDPVKIRLVNNVGRINAAHLSYWDSLTFQQSQGNEITVRMAYAQEPGCVATETNFYLFSSDVVSTVTVQVLNAADEVWGSTPVEFKAPVSSRRKGIKWFDQGYATDKGWDFNPEVLIKPGDTTTGTLSLKWRRPACAAVDFKYFQHNGVPVASVDLDGDGEITETEFDEVQVRQTLDDDYWWIPVWQHDLRVKFADLPTEGLPQDYVYFTNAQGVPIGTDGLPVDDPDNFSAPPSIPVTTNDQGKATVYVKAGPKIHDLTEFHLESTDWSVFPTP